MAAANLIARYKAIQQKLLPVGPLWRWLDSTFKKVLEAFAEEAARVHENKDVLLSESIPSQSTDELLLSDWENAALLQDEKPAAGDTELQRQQRVSAKVTSVYAGPSKQFWIDLAAKLGMTVDVYDNDEIVGADVARVDEARVEDDRVSEEGNQFYWEIEVFADPQSQLANFTAMVNRLKPAHTIVTIY